MKIYHSALKSIRPIGGERELDRYEHNGCIVFRHDICNGLTDDFNYCDVLYSEPAWLDGYELFIDRANKERSNYDQYLKSIATIIEQWDKPIWLIIGKHARNKLPVPDRMEPIGIHGYQTEILGWNDNQKYQFKTNYDFIYELSNQYSCIGDFNCGYGNTGKIFKKAGKAFVMSDINGKCIYYIASEIMDYEGSVS